MAKPTRVNVRSEPRGPKLTLHAPCLQGVRESRLKSSEVRSKGRYSCDTSGRLWVRVVVHDG
eukprot:5115069-Prymnesium_polylepis.1